MNAVTRTRHKPFRNMHRYYRLDVQPDLFGSWCGIREWKRIGQPGKTRIMHYLTPADTDVALAKQRQAKERRGYKNPFGES